MAELAYGRDFDVLGPEVAEKGRYRQEETHKKEFVGIAARQPLPSQLHEGALASSSTEIIRQNKEDRVTIGIKLLDLRVNTAVRIVLRELGPHPGYATVVLFAVLMYVVSVLVGNKKAELKLKQECLERIQPYCCGIDSQQSLNMR